MGSTRHCELCGRPSPDHDGVPTCAAHGPRWCMVRSAPVTGVVVHDADERRVLLARRARDPFRGAWEIPGGFVDAGEHPADTARREVREELGVELTITALVGIYAVESRHSGPLLGLTYAGTITGEPDPDPAEVTDWRWFPIDAVPYTMAGDHRARLQDWLDGSRHPLPAGGYVPLVDPP